MKKWFAQVALVLGLVALVPPAVAQVPTAEGKDTQRTTVGVRTSGASQADDRGRYDYEIAPTKYREDFIALYNYAYTPVTVRLLPRDASNTLGGDFTVQPSAAAPQDVGKWIAVAKTEVRIKPRSMTIVPFQIGVPYNATPGDHVGALIVSLLAHPPGKNAGVVVEHRVGLRVYLRVPGQLKPQLSIEHLKSTFSGGLTAFGLGRTTVSYDVHNTGNIRLSTTQALRLSRTFGLPDAASADPAKIAELLPGSTIRVTRELGRHWTIGTLTTSVTLHPMSPDKGAVAIPSVHATLARTVIPWALVLILLVLLGLGYGYRRWRRSRRAPAVAAGPSGETAEEHEAALVGEGSGKHRAAGATALTVLALIALGGVLATAPAGRAEASPAPTTKIWKATVSQKSGTDDQPFSILTSGACPSPSRNVIGRLFGAGFPKEGVNVVGNSSGGVSPDGPFEMPLQQTLRDTMVQQPQYTPFRGDYKVVIRCILPAYVDRSYGDYVAKIRFTDQHHWVALPPVSNVIGPHLNPDGSMTGPSSPGHPGATTHPEVPTATPTPTPKKGGSSTGPGGTAAGDTTATAAQDGGSSAWPAFILIGGGLLVAVATILLLRRTRSTV
ncbi:MAG: hypothetical protein ACJ716_10690 [Marmoricola sp.]